jgi:hypothetical protein
VLLLLMVLPAITYQGSDISYQYGLKKLFWFGRSNCQVVGGNFECERGDWISAEGWQEILRQFVVSTRADEYEQPLQQTMWIYTPDFNSNGQIQSIQNITTARSEFPVYFKELETIKTIQEAGFPSMLSAEQKLALQHWLKFDQIETLEVEDAEFMELINFQELNSYDKLTWLQVQALQTLHRNMFPNELFWREHETCNGPVVSSKPECQIRNEEMQLIMYTPQECKSGEVKNCDQLVTYARI